MTYSVRLLKLTRGSSLTVSPWEVASYERKKLAKGETKALAHSTFNVLDQHLPWCVINYYEYEDYYVFILEDVEGIFHEVHVFMVEVN